MMIVIRSLHDDDQTARLGAGDEAAARVRVRRGCLGLLQGMKQRLDGSTAKDGL